MTTRDVYKPLDLPYEFIMTTRDVYKPLDLPYEFIMTTRDVYNQFVKDLMPL